MRQYDLNFTDELIVDNFAGGGGASIGIEAGLNRPIDIAINHDEIALQVHKLNHPHTLHIQSDVFEVDPIKVCDGRPVGLAWFSPDCKHFSKAKGGTPVEKQIRGLAWVARKWAKTVRPRIIILENVEEFLTWGPLTTENGKSKPDHKRTGLTFHAFNQWFLRAGYKTDLRILKACDYGAPTIRKRLFWVARCDNQPIIWPDHTHGPKNSIAVKKKKLKPYRTAAECIDWTIPCPSIFMDQNQADEYRIMTGTRVKRPLADATLKRIAKGVVKYVLNEKKPFIVTYYGQKTEADFRGQGIDEPLKTQTTENRHAIVTPYIIPIANYNGSVIAQPLDDPLRTITAFPKGGSFALCTPFISRQFGQSIGHGVNEPAGSITAGGGGKEQLVSVIAAPMVARQFNTGVCHPVTNPLATIMSGGGGGKNQLVCSFLAKHYTGVTGSSLKNPIGTITSVDHHSLVTAELSKTELETGGSRVAAFLIKDYGTSTGVDLREPLHTISTHDRFGLATVIIKGEPWVIVDIGIRMLQPHELMKAQGFPNGYNLGNNSNTAKVRLIGNSVPPPFSEAMVRANIHNQTAWKATA